MVYRLDEYDLSNMTSLTKKLICISNPNNVAKHIRSVVKQSYEVAYTDGSSRRTKGKSMCGLGVYYPFELDRNASYSVMGRPDSNRAELAAIHYAMYEGRDDKDILILTDSLCSIDMLRRNYETRESFDKFTKLLKSINSCIHDRKHSTVLAKVRGHSGVLGNVQADILAKTAPADLYWYTPDVTPQEIQTRVLQGGHVHFHD